MSTFNLPTFRNNCCFLCTKENQPFMIYGVLFLKHGLNQILRPPITTYMIQALTQCCFPAKFELSGPQSSAFLDRIVAGSVPKPGRTTLAHMLTHGGKVCIL